MIFWERSETMTNWNTQDFDDTSPGIRRGMNREIFVVTLIFVLIFVGIAAYYILYVNVWSGDYLTSTYNTRQNLNAERVERGDILARDGTVLVTTRIEDGEQVRVYPYGEEYAQVLGYSTHGKSGVERAFNYYLLSSHVNLFEQIRNTARGDLQPGDSVVTTLDPELQDIAYRALSRYEGGAVVALDPNTGEILCMASYPSYDPNEIADIWDRINADTASSVLVNRATSGYYMPGSTFKIVTALASIRQMGASVQDTFTYDCGGVITAEDYSVRCNDSTAHGTVGFRSAFAQSCNGAFISLGLQLDRDQWADTAEDLLYNASIDFELSEASGRFALNGDSGTWETMLTSIGQGSTVVTPLQNALIAAAVANDGVVMRPRIVSGIVTSGGSNVRSFGPSVMTTAMTEAESDILTDMMIAVVNEGTARILRSDAYQAAGKTGTAENTSAEGDANALFTGFAPADDPQIVVSVVIEGGGSSYGAATSIARDIFDAYLT